MRPEVDLWRIAAATAAYRADDSSGAGAAHSGGRWNDLGEFVLYASTTPELAVLETVAHLPDGGLPLDRYLLRITVPAALWKNSLSRLRVAELPGDWDAIPGSRSAREIGSRWYVAARHLLLAVPSAIVPEATNVLINARHTEASALRVRIERKFEYSALFR